MDYILQAALEWFKQQDLSHKTPDQAAKIYKDAVKAFRNKFTWKKNGDNSNWKMQTFKNY